MTETPTKPVRKVTMYCEPCGLVVQSTGFHKVCEPCLGRKCRCGKKRIKDSVPATTACSVCDKQHDGACLTFICDTHLEQAMKKELDYNGQIY